MRKQKSSLIDEDERKDQFEDLNQQQQQMNANGSSNLSSQLQRKHTQPIGANHSIPQHRLTKRPISILKNKKHHTGLRGTFHHSVSQHYWGTLTDENGQNQEQIANERGTGQKTISEINFFECREITNCEFIYKCSEKDQTRSNKGLLSSLTKFFNNQVPSQAEITAMCAIQDLLFFGFSNGVLIVLDIDKLESIYTHKEITKNNKPIDKIKLFQMDTGNVQDQFNLLFVLSEGFLTFYRFPKIMYVNELTQELSIVEFQPYQISRTAYLAILQKNPMELKIFKLRRREEYVYLTKVELYNQPLAFSLYRDIFLISYKTHAEYLRIDNKGKQEESITRFNLWQNDSSKYMPFPVFDESIQLFVITQEDYSFYMDLKGVYDREFNKIKWSDDVINVEIVSPYLIGFLPNSIEIKNIFNPNRVIQKIELLSSTIFNYSIAYNHLTLRELDSMYLLLNRNSSNTKVLLKMQQIDPRVQINLLIERKLYSTGLKFCDLLLDYNFEGMNKEQYEKLQREKGFYNFIVKRCYSKAKEIFKEFKVPLQNIVLLFSEIYPQAFIQRMIEMFDINLKEIPYFHLLKQKDFGEMMVTMDSEYQRMFGNSRVNFSQYISTVQDKQDALAIQTLSVDLDSDKLQGMKEFLHFFIKKRFELVQKIEELALLERRGETSNKQGNSGKYQIFQSQEYQYGNQQMMKPERKRSFGENLYQEGGNQFDFPLIHDKKYHQSDNENTDQKMTQFFFLRIMTEIYIFHSIILLLKSDEEKEKIILKNEFYNLLKSDNALPSDFCIQVLFNYRMYEEALLFLFYKKEYKELLNLIQREFERNTNSSASSNPTGSGEILSSNENKKNQEFWIHKFVKYCQKINSQGMEDITLQHTEWIFKYSLKLGVQCMKKIDNKNPSISEKILLHLRHYGGVLACIDYMEYLIFECKVDNPVIHTELGCIYVEYISAILENYKMSSQSQNNPNEQHFTYSDAANEDEEIFQNRKKLIKFLQFSDFFQPMPILEILPPNFLLKERAIILIKSRRYREAFKTCIDELNDAEYAITIAHRGFKWHKDKSIYFYLFTTLLQYGQREEAMNVLKANFHFISYDKVTNFIHEDDKFDLNLNQFYQKAFIEIEKVSKELSIFRNLTQFEYYQKAEQLWEAKNEHIMIKDDTECRKCSKKIANYPFYYLPRSKEIVHYHCFINENQAFALNNQKVRNTGESPNKVETK